MIVMQRRVLSIAAYLSLGVAGAWAQDATPIVAGMSTGLRELSPWTMFLSADILVKCVMVGLAIASLITWTVFIAKSFEIGRARRGLSDTLERISDARTLYDARAILGEDRSVVGQFLAAAAQEEHLSGVDAAEAGVLQRAASRFSEIVRAETRAVRRGMGVLATIGSTAPFVGLFGTVWGIMNSFIGISKSQTTNLAVVAPGIAEALLATAIGLVAAIPAVIIYNHFTRMSAGYLDIVNRASGAATRLLSRDLEQGTPRRVLSRAAE
jgi:biopolymer transport protein ExbB